VKTSPALSWRTGLQHCQPVEWQARHRYPRLPVARFQCCPNGRRGSKTDGRDEEALPARLDYAISLDQTSARHRGHEGIIETLLIAIVLVILVVFLFLQDWRATLIPLLAVPGLAGGNLFFLPLFGFSINTTSMSG